MLPKFHEKSPICFKMFNYLANITKLKSRTYQGSDFFSRGLRVALYLFIKLLMSILAPYYLILFRNMKDEELFVRIDASHFSFFCMLIFSFFCCYQSKEWVFLGPIQKSIETLFLPYNQYAIIKPKKMYKNLGLRLFGFQR